MWRVFLYWTGLLFELFIHLGWVGQVQMLCVCVCVVPRKEDMVH